MTGNAQCVRRWSCSDSRQEDYGKNMTPESKRSSGNMTKRTSSRRGSRRHHRVHSWDETWNPSKAMCYHRPKTVRHSEEDDVPKLSLHALPMISTCHKGAMDRFRHARNQNKGGHAVGIYAVENTKDCLHAQHLLPRENCHRTRDTAPTCGGHNQESSVE